LESFIDRSGATVDGGAGFERGTPPDEFAPKEISGAVTCGGLEYFQRKAVRKKPGGKGMAKPE
jgi:hypothetical protein